MAESDGDISFGINVEVTGESDVKRLANAIDELEKRGTAIESVVSLLNQLNNVRLTVGTQVSALARGLEQLNSYRMNPAGIDSTIQAVDRLDKALSEKSVSVGNHVNSLSRGLEKINAYRRDASGFDATVESVKKLDKELGDKSLSIGNHVNSLANGLEKLNSFKPNTAAFDSVIATVTRLSDSLSDKQVKVGSDVAKLVNSLDKLSQVKVTDGVTSGTNEAVASVSRLAESAGRIDASGLSKLSRGSSEATDGVRRVASTLDEAGGESVTFSQRLGQLYNSLHKIASVYFVVSTLGHLFRDLASAIMAPLNAAADYTEQMNLMTVSLGQYAEEAYNYASRVQQALGIDQGEFLSNQGTFMTLAKGFGVASDAAYTMSGNLTRLSYDLASFFNLSNSEAFDKVRSAMSGETEAIKQLGFDMSQARLQQIAYQNGITTSVSKMTQADKAYLRYIAIMEQVSWAHGDLARTIQSPANQMRVLQAQATTAARSIGNLFMPMLSRIIPVAVAVVKVITTLANKLAEIFGGKGVYHIDFGQGGELQSDLGGVGDAGNDASNGLGNAGNAAKGAGDKAKKASDNVKELKRQLMGFDEINMFSKQSDTSGSGGSGDTGGSGGGGGNGGSGGGGGLSGIELPTYEWEFDDSFADEWVDKIMDFLNRLWEVIKPTVDVLAGFLDQIKKQWEEADVLGAFENAFIGIVDFLSTIVRTMARVLGPVIVAFNIPATLESAFNFIGQLFTTLADVLEEVGQVLGVFSQTFLAPLAEVAGKAVRGALDGMTSALKSFSSFIKTHEDEVRTVIAGILGALGALAAYKGYTSVVSGLSTIGEAAKRLKGLWDANVLTLSSSLGVVASEFPRLASAITPVQGAVEKVEAAIGGMSGPVAIAVAAIGAVVGALAWWATQTDDGRRAWKDFSDSISSAIEGARNTIGAALANVGSALGNTVSALANLAGAVGRLALGTLGAIIKAIANAIAAVATILAKVLELVLPIIDAIASPVINAIAGVIDGIASAINWLASCVSSVTGFLGGFINGLFGVETASAATADGVDGASDALSEHEQKVQDNIQAINDYDDANGTLQRTLQNTGMSVEDLANYLADTDQTVDEFVQSVEDYADSIINGFDRIDTQSQISLDDMVGNLTSNIQTTEQWSANLDKLMADTGLSSNDALVQEMISGGPEKYARALDEIVSSSDNERKFVDAANEYGNSLTSKFGDAVRNGVPDAQQAGQELTSGVGTGMDAGAGQTAQTAADVDQQTVQQFGSHYGEAKDAGRNLAGGFGDGVREASNDASKPAKEVMSQVVQALNGGNGYAQALSAGRNLVGGYGDGIAQASASAVAAARSAMSQVVNGLNGGAGYNSAKSAGRNLMGGYKDGLQASLNSAVQVARSAMNQVNQALGSGNSTARSKGSQMMQGFASGLSSGIGSARNAGRSAATSAQDGMGSNYYGANSAGRNEMGGFIDGLRSGMGNQAWWKGRDAAVSAQNGLGSNYWGAYSAGSNMGWGFNNGLVSVQWSIYSTAQAIANNAAARMRNALRIHSPSRVTMEIGEYFGLGAAVGIEKAMGDVLSSVSELSDGMVESLDVVKDASKLGREIGRAFGDAVDSSIGGAELGSVAGYANYVADMASKLGSGGFDVPAPHDPKFNSSDDAYVTDRIASAFAQGLMSVQMGGGDGGTGKDTTIVLRVGNEDLARAVIKGQDSLARRGVVKLA